MTSTTAASQKITDELIYIKSVYWQSPSDPAHLVNLIDKEGAPLISLTGSVDGGSAGQSQQWTIEGVYLGIYCDDMDSGTLYIYTR